MEQRNALVIFARNLVHGKVKTRLAATIGADRAYEVYKYLLAHTHRATQNCQADKIVYYSEEVAADDLWDDRYQQAAQDGGDLGERMRNAFGDVFRKGYTKVVLIGTDCPSLNEDVLREAFAKLDYRDVVIGPAHDGGYYLLGMRTLCLELFTDVAWSTNTVFETTKAICDKLNLCYAVLPRLHDIDEENDLVHLKNLLT